MFNIGMENKPYEYTIKHDGIRAPYVTPFRHHILHANAFVEKSVSLWI